MAVQETGFGNPEDKEIKNRFAAETVYGAIREQMDILSQKGLAYDVVPGVSSFCAAAASLQA